MQNRLKNIFELNQIVQVVGIIVAMSLIYNTVRVVQKNYGLQQQVDRLKDEIAIIELENQQFKYNIEYYKTDAYLELAAREKFNKKAPGERVVALPKIDYPDQIKTEAEQKQELKPQYQSNLDQWLYFLFGREPS
jgi:cell division protein FtsB